MKIALQPKVYLVGRTQVYTPGLFKFFTEQNLKRPGSEISPTDNETLTEIAGRICYASFGSRAVSKSTHQYLQNLLGRNPDGSFKPGPAHGSVLEHATFNFIIVGAGRGWSHEQVRHRSGWAYSQLSTRYVDFEQQEDAKAVPAGDWEPTFCIPPLAQLSAQTKAVFTEEVQRSQKVYGEMVKMIMDDLINNPEFVKTLSGMPEREYKRFVRKAARGAARDLLVHACEAMMFMSANARALWNCIVLRASEHAEGVIRDVFVQIARIMEGQMPSVFHSLKYGKCWDGSEYVEMPRDKV